MTASGNGVIPPLPPRATCIRRLLDLFILTFATLLVVGDAYIEWRLADGALPALWLSVAEMAAPNSFEMQQQGARRGQDDGA